MRVRVQPELLFFVANLRSPNSREREEEALLRRKAVDLLIALLGMFIERLLQCGISDLHSAYVRDVFALGQFAIDVQTRQSFVFVVLIDYRLAALFVSVGGFFRPPIGQIADLVVLPALIVETVRHFMSDHATDPAVVHRVVSVREKERRLQNAGWKN